MDLDSAAKILHSLSLAERFQIALLLRDEPLLTGIEIAGQLGQREHTIAMRLVALAQSGAVTRVRAGSRMVHSLDVGAGRALVEFIRHGMLAETAADIAPAAE